MVKESFLGSKLSVWGRRVREIIHFKILLIFFSLDHG